MTLQTSSVYAPAEGPSVTHRPERARHKESFNVAAHSLRGIASLMVFFAHLLGGTAKHIYNSNPYYVDTVLPYWNFGTFGVCLFFIISGFVILPSAMRYSAGEFAARRFMRIYPLFFVLSVVYVLLNAKTDLYPDSNNLTAVLSGFAFLNLFTGTEQLTPNAWSLTFEVWFYIFTATVVSFGIRRFRPFGLTVASIAAALFLARYPISFYFLGGLIVRVAYDRYEWMRTGQHRLAEGAMLAACILLACQEHFEYSWQEFSNPVVPLLILSSIAYFALSLSSNSLTSRVLGNSVTRYFGTVSYSLYLVHPYTYYAVRALFAREGLFTSDIITPMVAFVILTSAVTLVMTHVIHQVLELWPYEAVYRQKIYRNAASQPKGAWRRLLSA